MEDSADRERFYDEEIAPALLNIAAKLRERRMYCSFSVEFNHREVGLTAHVDLLKAGPEMRLAYYGAACRGNVDSLIMQLMMDDKKNIPEGGQTNSICLRQIELADRENKHA